MSRQDIPSSQAQPLTDDERAWAGRLRKIGPQAGPSPALDAKILAAAHAAVAKRPQRALVHRRWPALIGAAASLVIVVGLAWQLQPLLRPRPSLGEVPPTAPIASSEGSLSPDVLAAASPAAKTAVDNPPPPPAAPPPLAPRRASRITPLPAVADRPAAHPVPQHQRAAKFGDDSIPPYSGYAGTAEARQSASKAAANDVTARESAGERRERAAATSPQPFPAASADAAMDAMPAPAPANRAIAPAREASSREATASSRQTAPTPSAMDDSLHRVEAGGSPITHVDSPVSDDARLDTTAWLQRIRDRRDADDLEGARKSLALFRESHPRTRLPDDIAQLAD